MESVAPPEPAGASIAHGAVATAEQVRHHAEEVASDALAKVGAAAHGATEAIDLDRVAGLWPSVVEHMRQSGAGMLSAAFDAARPVAVDARESTLAVGFPPSPAFNRRKAEAKENRERVLDAIRTVIGAPLRPVFVTLEGEAEPDAAAPGAPPPPTAPLRTTCTSGSSPSSTPRCWPTTKLRPK